LISHSSPSRPQKSPKRRVLLKRVFFDHRCPFDHTVCPLYLLFTHTITTSLWLLTHRISLSIHVLQIERKSRYLLPLPVSTKSLLCLSSY
jgi:hypothetical protein